MVGVRFPIEQGDQPFRSSVKQALHSASCDTGGAPDPSHIPIPYPIPAPTLTDGTGRHHGSGSTLRGTSWQLGQGMPATPPPPIEWALGCLGPLGCLCGPKGRVAMVHYL